MKIENEKGEIEIITIDCITGEGFEDMLININSEVGYAGIWLDKQDVKKLITELNIFIEE